MVDPVMQNSTYFGNYEGELIPSYYINVNLLTITIQCDQKCSQNQHKLYTILKTHITGT